MTDFCSQCEFSSVERAINPFSGQEGVACICNAGPDDICLASLAMERNLELGEVVIPCPHCFADLDGKGGMCDNCGAIALFAELQPGIKPVADSDPIRLETLEIEFDCRVHSGHLRFLFALDEEDGIG